MFENIPKTFNDIPKTHIISPSCHERFIPLDMPETRVLRQHGVLMAGASSLVAPYEMGRPDPEWHVLMYTRAGHATYQTPTESATLSPGTLCLFPAHQAYRYWTDDRWLCAWFHIDDIKRWVWLRGLPVQCGETRFGAQLLAAVDGLLDEMAMIPEDEQAHANIAAYAEIIARLLAREICSFTNHTTSPLPRPLQQMRQFIRSQPGHAWSVEELAVRLEMSPVSLHRLCCKHLGVPPKSLVTTLRMQYAQEILRSSDYSLTHIAAMVGYATPFAFSRAFTQHAGVCPKQFRQRYRDGR